MTVFLRVNDRDVTVEQAVRHALVDPQGRRLVESLVEQELIRQHARSIGLETTAEELQAAANAMRYERGLTDRGRTLEWVQAHGQTLASVEAQIETLLLRRKMADAIPDAEVEEYYRTHRDALEYVVLFSIRAASEAEGASVRARLDAGEPFPVVAADASRDATTRRAGGLVGRLRRAEMSEAIAQAVFAAEVGRPIGPLPTEKGFGVFLVAARQVPTLAEEAPAIRLLLFETMLARLRAAAVVRFPLIDADASL